MSRLPAVLLVLVLLAASLPAGALAQTAEPWTLSADTERVELDLRSDERTADEVRFTIEDRTGLVLLVGETLAAILEALGLRTGYSQVVTWTSGDGPTITCPGLGANLWCESASGAGLALVPNPGRALLLARAPETPGHAELTVMVSERSLGFDLAVVAVGLALSVVAGETAKVAAMKVASEVVFDLVIRVLPEAMAAADAFLAGDYDAAVAALGALVLVVAQLITDNAAYWTAVLGIAVITKLVPFLHEVELALAAAKAVPAILTLVAAMGNEERTMVRVAWAGAGEGSEVSATPGSASEAGGTTEELLRDSCAWDPGLLDSQSVADAFPDVAGDAAVFTHVLAHESDDVRRFADLLGVPHEDLPFVVRVSSGVETYALRVPGACPDELLAALSHSFSSPSSSPDTPAAWTPIWSSARVGGRPGFVAAVPDEFAPGWTVYALIRGDVLFFTYGDTPEDVEDLFSGLRFASDGDSVTPHRWACQVPADGVADMGDASALAAMVGGQGGLVGEYQVVATDDQAVTPEILEQTCKIVADRLNATTASVLGVRVVGSDRVQVLLGPTTDEARIRRLIGTTGVLEFTPVPDGCIDQVVPDAPSPDCLEEAEPLFNGTEIASARIGQDSQTGELVVNLELKEAGARLFDEYAERNLHGFYAIVLDGVVKSAPRVNATQVGGRAQIAGNFSVNEAENLVIVLRFGSLPLDIREVGFQESAGTAADDSSSTGPSPTVAWTDQFGTAEWDLAEQVGLDASGSRYVLGETLGTFPGEARYGAVDSYLRKYDSAGTPVWTRQFGTPTFDYPSDIAVGLDGVVVVGETFGAFSKQSSQGGQDAFVRSYDLQGNVAWTLQFGSPDDEYVGGAAIDDSGNVYVVGSTLGRLPGSQSFGGQDAFVRKYGSDGRDEWTRQFGTVTGDEARAVAAGSSGAVFVAGWTAGAIATRASTGSADAFIRRYEADGTVTWTDQFGTDSDDYATDIAIAPSGDLYVVGETWGAFPQQAQLDGSSAFLRKVTADGRVLWTRQFGKPATAVTVGPSGEVFVVGLDSGSATETGAHVAKFSPDGVEVWREEITAVDPSDWTGASDVAVSAKGLAFVVGSTAGTVADTQSSGSHDGYLVAYAN